MTEARDDGGSEVVRLPQRTPFTMVDNPIIRGMTDYVALGLYLDMLSYPSGWRINIRQLAKTHKQGRQVLTDAMNDLIGRGLVFRARFQEASGRWRTRTYVCSNPVSLAELRDIQRQFHHRCVIETSAELLEALSRPGEAGTAPRPDQSGPAKPRSARPGRAFALVAPSTRFPAPGSPEPGAPAAGAPAPEDVAPQRPEGSRKNPLPPPTSPAEPHSSPQEDEDEEDEEDGKASTNSRAEHAEPTASHPDRDQVLDAVARAWPALGWRDLRCLEPLVEDALADLPTSQVLDHLVTNTGGARNPLALLRARLGNLPPPRRQTRLPDWCGSCTSETYRWLQDTDGQPLQPCPTCSPQATRQPAEPQALNNRRRP